MLLKFGTNHKPENQRADPQAPMPAGPIIYREDGKIDWGHMWDSFCMLALDGGPPHRGRMLPAPQNPDVTDDRYWAAAGEIIRGIYEVSGFTAVPDAPGWLKMNCTSAAQARWLAEAIREENVAARHQEAWLYVPVGHTFRLQHEVKNVVTAVAKTTHYWQAHLAVEVKQTLLIQAWLKRLFGFVVRR